MLFVKPLSELGLADPSASLTRASGTGAGRAGLALVGGKAASLGDAISAGFPVPPGFCVTTDAYRAFVAANNLQTEITRLSASMGVENAPLPESASSQIRALFESGTIPPKVASEIRSAYTHLFTSHSSLLTLDTSNFRHFPLPTSPVAVRSSATAEDLPGASFAGQHDTFLNVTDTEALLTAVRTCWASLWSPRAVNYRQQQDWGDQEITMAVVVQAMVQAEWAGVMFTANPVTGQQGEIVIESVAGLGEALVSGEARGERHVVEKATRRISAGESLIPHQIIEELSGLGLQIEKAFGQPQDIEWAYAGGRCYILQSRPITALSAQVPQMASKPGRRYSRVQRANAANMVERTPLPYHPFDYSLFFRPGMERAFQAIRSLGFSPPALEDVFIEIADGVVQIVPPDPRPTLKALVLPFKLGTALRADPNAWLEKCRRNLVTAAHRIDEEATATLSEKDLLDRIETLRTLQMEFFLPRFGCFPRGMLITQVMSFLIRLTLGKEAPKMETELLSEIPCATTRMNHELGRLARRIRGLEEMRQVFLEESPERIQTRLGESVAGRALLTEVETFLRVYGYRETTMPASALPAWRDDPSIVYGLLKGLATGEQGHSVLDVDGSGRPERAKQEVIAALSRGHLGLGRQLLLPLFLWSLDAVRDFIAFREDSHFYLFMPFPVIRRLALELGRRMKDKGILDEADGIFFLEIEEIKNPAPAADMREKVQKRKRARRSVEGRFTSVPAELLAPTNTTGEVRGVPVSPGQAVGRARIIQSEKDFWKLQKGEVLVAPYTNPAWTPLFALATAVVVDAGGMGSHAAIVAREYGVPAVMGAGNATRVLREGQRVMVDGSVGTVSLIRVQGA